MSRRLALEEVSLDLPLSDVYIQHCRNVYRVLVGGVVFRGGGSLPGRCFPGASQGDSAG